MIDDDNKVSAIDTPEAARVAARLGIRPDDPAWVLAQAVADAVMAQARAKQAATQAKIEVRTIPSKIKIGAQEAGRELREELSREFVTVTKSYLKSHRLVSFSAAGGVILLSILAGAVFCLMTLAATGHLNPSDFAIKPTTGGVEIQAPGPVDVRWCQSSRRDCLLLKTGEAK